MASDEDNGYLNAMRDQLPLKVKSIHPREPDVRFCAHRQSKLDSSVLIHPVPARSEHVLDFQFADVIQIQDSNSFVS